MSELIKHNCSVEGLMSIEKGKPCNWCDKLDKPKLDKPKLTIVKVLRTPD